MTFPQATFAPDRTFTLRPFADSDYPAVLALFIQHDTEFLGGSNFTEEILRADWESQVNFDPADSVRLAVSSDGAVVGMVNVNTSHPVPVRPNAWLMTLPEWSDATSPALLDWAFEQARTVFPRVPENARVVLQAGTHTDNHRVQQHLRARRMTTDRGFYTMLIQFNGQQPPEPVIPEGIRLVTFGQYPKVEAWARALKEGFADHRGAAPNTPLEYTIERLTKVIAEPRFDPSIWWLPLDENDNVAGLCTTFSDSDEFPNTAYVPQLAILPTFRRRGLGLALLHVAFGEHFRRGRDGVCLGVDASSLTNAVALYERAGMSVASRWDAYELELRPGVELTKQ